MNTTNQNLTFKGNPLKVMGKPLAVGEKLPQFKLTANDMSDLTNTAFAGKKLIVLSIPSVDTPVCAIETKKFNEEASKLGKDVAVLVVSEDLPFAQKRWCAAEGVNNVVTASDFKYRGFGETFGTFLPDVGILSRAVFVADASGTICHVEYVRELGEEPDYAATLAAVKNA